MKEKRIGKSSVKPGTDWNRLRSQNDIQIRRAIKGDPDARSTYAEFWKKARIVMPVVKRRLQSALMRIFSNGCERKKATKRASMRCSALT